MSAEELERLSDTVKAQNEMLRSIFAQPAFTGVVVGFGRREYVIGEKGQLKKEKPPKVTVKMATKDGIVEFPQPNHIELLVGESYQVASIQGSYVILDATEAPLNGHVITVRSVSETGANVTVGGAETLVALGKFPNLKKGDRVILDASNSVVIQSLGKDKSNVFCEDTKVTWNDIGGLDHVKDLIKEAIELPLQFPELFRSYGQTPSRGILLYGPAGNGKTLLGRATASSVAKIAEKSAVKTGFIYIKGPEILNKYVGESESRIRSIFDTARSHKEEHGYPAVIFIDEAESILNARGSGRSSDVERTIVPQFLSEMDGLTDSGAIVMLATNRPDIIDQAVIRDGRVDQKVHIPRPTKDAAISIFDVHARNMPFSDEKAECIAAGVGTLFSDDLVLYNVIFETKGAHKMFLRDITNGAMVANVMQIARAAAIRRDIQGKKKSATGVSKTDVSDAVQHIYSQHLQMLHKQEIADYAMAHDDTIRKVERITSGGFVGVN